MQKLLLSVWFWNKNDECPKIHMIWKHCNEAEGHYFICSRGSSLIWCLWYVHFQTLMDLTSIHLAAWAGVPLFSWSLSYYTLLNSFKPQPSVLWLSLAWHITSLRHCAGIQKETPGIAKILFVAPPSNPLWFLLFASFFLCIPDAPSDPPAQVPKLHKASCGTVSQMERANI